MRPLILGHRRNFSVKGSSYPQGEASSSSARCGPGPFSSEFGDDDAPSRAFMSTSTLRHPPPRMATVSGTPLSSSSSSPAAVGGGEANPIKSMDSSNNSITNTFGSASSEQARGSPPPLPRSDTQHGGGGESAPVLLLFDRPSARQKQVPLDLSGIISAVKRDDRNSTVYAGGGEDRRKRDGGGASGATRRKFLEERSNSSGGNKQGGGTLLPFVLSSSSSSAPSSARGLPAPSSKFVSDVNEFSPQPQHVLRSKKKAMSAGSRRRSTNLLDTVDEFDRYNPFPQKKAAKIPIIVDEGSWWGESPAKPCPPPAPKSPSNIVENYQSATTAREGTGGGSDGSSTKPQAPLHGEKKRFLRSNSCF